MGPRAPAPGAPALPQAATGLSGRMRDNIMFIIRHSAQSLPSAAQASRISAVRPAPMSRKAEDRYGGVRVEFDGHPFRVTLVPRGRAFGEEWRAFDSQRSAAGEPWIGALMAIPGVQIVAVRGGVVRVIRDPETPWEEILPAAVAVVRSWGEGSPGG